MTQQYIDVQGVDFTLPAPPPITDPPLSLLGEVRNLIDLEGLVARRQQAVEKLASAQELLEGYDRLAEAGLAGGDAPGEADSEEDAAKALAQQQAQWDAAYADAEGGIADAAGALESLDTALKELQRFERGFVYLPEISNKGGVSTFAEDTLAAIANPTEGALKPVGPNQEPFLWYDPFIVVGLDSRSTFGWPRTSMADRVGRASRALRGHESWQAEREFWSGEQVPTNPHLTASPNSALVSAHRTLNSAFPNPDAAPTTVLGTPASLSDSLAALDQSIANADGGTGMVHATPYVVQKWSQVYPFLRDSSGNIRTVNNNLIVPGYGYPGTGPDQASRSVADGVLDSTTTVTSASVAFTNFDIGMPIEGEGIPAGAVIVAVTNPTTVVISEAATETDSGVTLTLPGTGGDQTGSIYQWAYATDMIYHCQGDVMTYPLDLREMSPDLPVDNLAEARAERTHAFPSNQFVRAAVLVDTTTP